MTVRSPASSGAPIKSNQLMDKIMAKCPRNVLATLWVALVAFGLSVADAAAQRAGQAEQEGESTAVNRADLANSYLRVERAYFASVPDDPAKIAAANTEFDQATLSFFGRQFGETVKTLDQVTASLLGELSPLDRLAMSLRVRMMPPVLILNESKAPQAHVYSLYELESDDVPAEPIELRLRSSADHVVAKAALPAVNESNTGLDQHVALAPETGSLEPGSYTIELASGDDQRVELGRYDVVPNSLDAIRAANEKRLDRIATDDDAIEEAIAICRARNALLTDHPSDEQSSQFLVDPGALVAEIDDEITRLAKGSDPYARRAGDYWRTVQHRDESIPFRCYAPGDTSTNDPRPLLIAFHGAGGDENLFFEGYGNGIIKQLAEQHGLLIASPLTYQFNRDASEKFDALVESLSADYAVDPKRIYVLGHSMGAGTTARLAQQRPEQIAAACCLAGGRRFGTDELPPMLVVAAKLDPIARFERLKPAVEEAQEAGMPITLREVDNYGHTLVVGAMLPEVVEWLLGQTP